MKRFLSIILTLLLTVTAWAGNNILSVRKDIKTAAGKAVFVPIELTNDDEIVAAQFNVTLPFARTNDVFTLNEQRNINNHSVSCRDLGGNKYTIVIVNMENKPLGGNAGVLLSLPMFVSSDAQPNSSYDIKISDVILTNKKGDNIQTGNSTGKVTITSSPSPDIRPVNITFGKTSFMPEDEVTINWTVENIGDSIAVEGWTENVFLVSSLTGNRIYIGNTRSYATLTKGSKINRSGKFTIPASLGMDGDVHAEVTLVGNSGFGEYISNQENNTARSSATASLGKKLYLTADGPTIKEDSKSPFRMKLSRSGDWSTDETFSLTCLNTGLVTIPATVTIPAGQSGAYFYVNAINNTVVNSADQETITVSSSEYASVSSNINIEDDEFFTLGLKLSKNEITEGEATNLKITLAKKSTEDQVINLSTDYPKRFSFPSSVTIPAGQLEANIEIKTVNDDIADIQRSVAFYAVANHYNKGEVIALLNDNDVPDLEFDVSPNTISEGAGFKAIMATIRRTSAKNSNVTIKLTDDSNGALYFPTKTITLASGVEKAEFYIGAVDNNMQQEARTYTVTANVYISSCSCNASGELKGVAQQSITVLDNDSPSLLVSTNIASLSEGSDEEATVTIKRNTSPTGALTVNLSSDDSRIALPSTVTIPDGQQSVSLKVKATANSTTKDTKTVVITASANAYTQGTCWIQVVDETLPDLIISDFSVTPTDNIAGGTFTARMRIANKGVIATQKETNAKIYVDGEEVATFRIEKDLAPGGVVSFVGEYELPDKVKTMTVKAMVNPDHQITECAYINNESESVRVTAEAPYTLVVNVSARQIEPEATVNISGRLTGKNVANQDVEVYVINMGRREVLTTKSDEQGNYSTNYTPTSSQIGHFSVGACYPGQNLTEEMTYFDILGLRRQNATIVKHELTIGQPQTGNLVLYNPSGIELNNVHVETLSCPEDVKISFGSIARMEGGATQTIKYTIEGLEPNSDEEWHYIKLKITSNEKASFDMAIRYYNYSANGSLKASTNNIKTTMIKGESRDYQITVKNVGMGETGKMTLDLPSNQSWLTSVTPLTMASLASGEETTIILRMTPTDDMQLNVPMTGMLAINATNANGISIPYRIETVSGNTGKLTVEVWDEFTTYDESKPKVANAQVVIRHPSTNALITSGTTDETGVFNTELPEGYYVLNVSADDHDSYTNTILVDPGTDNKEIVMLPFQAIKITWDVVETTVEDKYDIKTTVTYETRVPKPVLEVIGPDSISAQNIRNYGSDLVYYVITNKGLITARDVTVTLGNIEGCDVTYLREMPFDLAPGATEVVPVRISPHLENDYVTTMAKGFYAPRRNSPDWSGFKTCVLDAVIDFIFSCEGSDLHDWTHFTSALAGCAKSFIDSLPFIDMGSSSGSGEGKPSKTTTTKTEAGKNSNGSLSFESKECDPCLMNILRCMLKTAICIYDHLPSKPDFQSLKGKKGKELFKAVAHNAKEAKEAADDVQGYLEGECPPCPLDDCFDAPMPPFDEDGVPIGAYAKKMANAISLVGRRQELPTHLQNLIIATELQKYYNRSFRSFITLYYGDLEWAYTPKNEMEIFTANVERYMDDEATLLNVRDAKPSNISDEQLDKFIENIKYAKTHDGELKDLKLLNYHENVIDWADGIAKSHGYEDTYEFLDNAIKEYGVGEEERQSSKSSVCASIKLQINQTMTMTRQAFLGTLTVFNGHESEPMTDIKLDLKVTNTDGDVATSHEFQIVPSSLDGFSGNLNFTDGWALGANATGTATITFIPTKYAAPTVPVEYSFGGSLTYTNPYTGATVSRELYPVRLTVKPSPELDLTYFMQRDILGDNALTADVVEKCVPAEFALLINNKGNGVATNVSILTNQPEIVDNEKGLLVGFEILSSTVNGKDRTLALGGSVASNFGNIGAKCQAYAQWDLKCDLLGHFTSYDVEATHVTSYDNPDLSLLDKVSIHELTHSLRLPVEVGRRDSIVAWLVNDIPDAKDCPDAIYFSDGRVSDVGRVQSDECIVKKLDRTHYQLTVKPGRKGWMYGNIADPVLGRSMVVGVTRVGDGQAVSARNFWQTEWTLRDGADPLKDYRLHFCDSVASLDDQLYVIEFMPTPDVELKVASITGLHTDRKIEEEQLKRVTVSFNKPIVAETFTSDDLSMRCQGKDVDVKGITISTEDNQSFVLDMTEATKADGYYVLKVATNTITDCEDFYGREDGKCDWIQFIGGVCKVAGVVWPEKSGKIYITTLSDSYSHAKAMDNVPFTMYNVQFNSRRNAPSLLTDEMSVPYGDEIVLEARPETGYQFKGWYMGDECVSTDETYTTYCLDHTTLKAVFYENNAQLLVEYNSNGGTVTGAGSGTYGIGKAMKLRALPADGYVFTGWIVDNSIVSTNEYYEFTMKGDMNVRAEFVLKGGKIGDVNVDGFITVSDVTAIANILLEKNVPGASLVYADVNSSKDITISDITPLNNMILSSNAKGMYNVPFTMYNLSSRRNANGAVQMYMDDVQMNAGTATRQVVSLDGIFRYTCFQMDVEVPVGIDIQNVVKSEGSEAHIVEWNRLKNGMYRIIGYSFDNSIFHAPSLADITFRASTGMRDGIYPLHISNILLGRADGSEVQMDDIKSSIVIGNATTAIENGKLKIENSPRIYDLQGRKRNNVGQRGVYIINNKKVKTL